MRDLFPFTYPEAPTLFRPTARLAKAGTAVKPSAPRPSVGKRVQAALPGVVLLLLVLATLVLIAATATAVPILLAALLLLAPALVPIAFFTIAAAVAVTAEKDKHL